MRASWSELSTVWMRRWAEEHDLPGFRLHPLKGDLAGCWSVSVSGKWRVVFRFDGIHACDVDLVDYH
ncbi:type II toxin-antitoxin system RelE/ParE family toxin [Marinimicrococcus flavescens]|uniref:Type II toxin-antitoxin system RelE/ParE family toxin n=1 Tax=Marinimicrococcus flavescens TaxID=3031815 RepID=A0AAP4D6P5_9PROT|nr:type II toxin-antitoxin system RelE/ParE family toxin [Marinimicrococcus flavescens]